MIVHQRFKGSGGLSCNTQVNTTNFKDPRIKTLGFFVFHRENMVNLKRQAEWVQLHTLTKQDLRKMILEKLERATAYYKANQKREIAQEQS